MFNLKLEDAGKRRPLTAVGNNGLRECLEDIFNDLEKQPRKLTVKEFGDVEKKVISVVDHVINNIQEPETELWNPQFYTGGHFEDVAIGAILLGKASGMNKEELIAQGLASLFHDIGKYMNLELYRKPDKFNHQDCEKKQEHPWDSYYMIASPALETTHSRIAANLIDGVIYHHKDYNGKGYPGYLIGDPNKNARTIRVIDSVEAMTTNNRPYKKIKTSEEAVQDLILNSGIMFDPKLVELMVRGYDKTHKANYTELFLQTQKIGGEKIIIH